MARTGSDGADGKLVVALLLDESGERQTEPIEISLENGAEMADRRDSIRGLGVRSNRRLRVRDGEPARHDRRRR